MSLLQKFLDAKSAKAESAAALAQVETLKAELAALKSEKELQAAKLAEAEKAAAEFANALPEFEARVQQVVNERIAAQGVPAAALPKVDAGTAGPKKISIEDYRAMSAKDPQGTALKIHNREIIFN